MTSQIASLKEKQILASKLQLKDNKCPVCDSNVEKLNPLFQEEHLKEEIIKLQEEIKLKEKENQMYIIKRKRIFRKITICKRCRSNIRAYSINTKEELEKFKKSQTKKQKKIPSNSIQI